MFVFKKRKKSFRVFWNIWNFFLIIVSYLSNYFLPHDLIFNSILLVTGLSLFILYLKENYNSEKKNIKLILIIFLILSVAIFSAKNHDDFPYYHFSYIHLLTNSNLSIGIGNLNHGFRTPSSIFYLASFLYLPKVNYQLIHLAPIFFVGFANYIFLKNIIEFLKKKKICF